MKKIFFYPFLSLILIQVSCIDTKDCHRNITIENNTNTSIYVLDNSDTSLMNYGTSPRITGRDYIAESQKTTKIGFARNNCIENYVNNSTGQKLSLFIIDGYTLGNVTWDTIRLKNKYLRRETLSVADLNARNWTITYP